MSIEEFEDQEQDIEVHAPDITVEANDELDKTDDELEQEHNDETEDDVTVSFGDDAPDPEEVEIAKAPQWVKELRKSKKESERKIRELEAKLAQTQQAENKPVVLGEKPTLESCDYDTDEYDQRLQSWYEQKRKVDDEAARIATEQEQANQAWQERISSYEQSKQKLGVKDFDDVESMVTGTLSHIQSGLILQAVKDPALMVLALGRNPTKLKELAAMSDPVQFTVAIAKLEDKLKVTDRKARPAPEKTLKGNARLSGTDSKLAELEAEAIRTGDRTKLIAFKKKLNSK